MVTNSWSERFGIAFSIAFGILVAVFFITYSTFKMVTASGQVAYCYVESFESHGLVLYDLRGHREWRPDSEVGQNFRTLGELKEAASLANCELH